MYPKDVFAFVLLLASAAACVLSSDLQYRQSIGGKLLDQGGTDDIARSFVASATEQNVDTRPGPSADSVRDRRQTPVRPGRSMKFEKFANVMNSLCDAWLLDQDSAGDFTTEQVAHGRSEDAIRVRRQAVRPGRSVKFGTDDITRSFVSSATEQQVIRPGRSADSIRDRRQTPVRPGRSMKFGTDDITRSFVSSATERQVIRPGRSADAIRDRRQTVRPGRSMKFEKFANVLNSRTTEQQVIRPGRSADAIRDRRQTVRPGRSMKFEKFANVLNSLCDAWLLDQDGAGDFTTEQVAHRKIPSEIDVK